MSENTTTTTTNIIVLSGLAICLVIVIVVAIIINPIAGVALGPLLLGVAAIIRAIRGKNNDKNVNNDENINNDEDVAGTDVTKPKIPLPVNDNLVIDRKPACSTVTESQLPQLHSVTQPSEADDGNELPSGRS